MGCLYLEIEGQSCLVGSIDQGLMKNSQIDLLNRMTKERARKSILEVFFPMATSPGIFQQITPNKSLQTFWPNYRLSIAMGLSTNPFVIAKSPRNNGWLLTIERDAVFKGFGGGGGRHLQANLHYSEPCRKCLPKPWKNWLYLFISLGDPINSVQQLPLGVGVQKDCRVSRAMRVGLKSRSTIQYNAIQCNTIPGTL